MKQTKILNLLLLILCVLAIILRITYISITVIDSPIRADAQQYVLYGYNLSHHGVYSKSFPNQSLQSDSFRSPGYPFLIALAFLIGDERSFYPIVLTTQAVLSAAMVPLTYALGCMLMPTWAALIAAMFVAFSPHLVSIAGYLLTETLFGFLLLAGITCFYKAIQQNRKPLYAYAGLLLGCAFLTNETFLPVPFILAITLFFSSKSLPERLRIKTFYTGVGAFLLVFSLCPVAWSLRNALVLPTDAPRGRERAITTMSHGAYPGFIYRDPRYRYFPYREDPMQPAFGASISNFAKIGWGRFKERPLRYLSWYILEKPYYTWSWNILQGQGDIYIYPVVNSLYMEFPVIDWTRLAMKRIHPAILLVSFAGILLFGYRQWHNKNDGNDHLTPLIVIIVCLYHTVLCVIFASWPRYSVPLRPELYLISLWTLHQVIKIYMNRGSARMMAIDSGAPPPGAVK